MAWSADGRTFFLSHSNAGSISRRRLFASVPAELGIPDGAAIDTEGGYWCALHGGGKLRRFAANGRIDRDVELPVSQPTMCAFAGHDLTTMYVTSASDQTSEEDRRRQPHAGVRLTVQQAAKYVPLAGQAVSAAMGYTAIRYLGEQHIQDCLRVVQTAQLALPAPPLS